MANRNCEFWLEFENKTRMHIAMLEPAEPTMAMIPPQDPADSFASPRRAEIGSAQEETIDIDGTMEESKVSPDASRLQKSSLVAGTSVPEPTESKHQTIESSIKGPDDGTTDHKTVTIDAS